MKSSVILIATALVASLACPVFAHVGDYGPTRYTRVGRHDEHHGDHHEVVIDRRRGPGWAGAIAGGILGAAAGLALGESAGPPVVIAPPVVGTVVPALPGACVSVPTYSGAVLYNCGDIYYQPFYEGTSLMYQVVPRP